MSSRLKKAVREIEDEKKVFARQGNTKEDGVAIDMLLILRAAFPEVLK